MLKNILEQGISAVLMVILWWKEKLATMSHMHFCLLLWNGSYLILMAQIVWLRYVKLMSHKYDRVKAMKVCPSLLGSFLDQTFDCTSKSCSGNHILSIDQNFRKVSTIFLADPARSYSAESLWKPFKAISFQNGMPRVSYIKAIDIWMLGCDTFVFVAFLEFTMAQVWTSIVTPNSLLIFQFQYLMRKSKANQDHPKDTKTCFGTPTTSGKIDSLKSSIFYNIFLHNFVKNLAGNLLRLWNFFFFENESEDFHALWTLSCKIVLKCRVDTVHRFLNFCLCLAFYENENLTF